ncbi:MULTISPECIES: hypothetical protein [Sporosarcina]|uniref:NEAT domain-containing protein n=1 Tax=Sporosarcina psychrophila TaxID=1476 RepID=A0ABV2KE88_SPOPS|nr:MULTISPECIES: hypothetical protein [Sporosarcina]AMQ05301.1 hypothetical protein AZE41_04780 [Sporosarcina psychrophila]QNK89021.1 hypothetical protein H7992_04665 [Sporosarcina sp. resist]
MTKTNVSRCMISTEEDSDNLYVKVKNKNQELSRQFTINAYSKNSPTKELLPVYVDNQPAHIDTLDPDAEKVYRIDVSNVKGQVIFEIIQKMGSSSIKVSKNSKNPFSVELHIK